MANWQRRRTDFVVARVVLGGERFGGEGPGVGEKAEGREGPPRER